MGTGKRAFVLMELIFDESSCCDDSSKVMYFSYVIKSELFFNLEGLD